MAHPTHAGSSFLKLSDGEAFSDVSAFSISPDSSWVVYRSDAQTDGAFELYSVPLDGSAPPVRISGLLPSGSIGIHRFDIAPDGQRVVYIAPQDSTGVDELYSVPIGGGTTTKLNSALVENGDVFGYALSPLGDRAVYLADQQQDGVLELYSAPITGGTVVKLNSPLIENGFVEDFTISPLGDLVVYRADQQQGGVFELYSVPITGGTVVKLNSPLVEDGDVQKGGFALSPLGDRVVYKADQEQNHVRELYSVPITGGTVVKLNSPLVEGGRVLVFSISPLGDRVVYWADQEQVNVDELYSVPITGGSVDKLNFPLVEGGDVFAFAISPLGDWVVYRADLQQDNVFELYSAPITGGAMVKLNGDISPAEGDVKEARFSENGEWVYYRADQEHDEKFSIFRAPSTLPNSDELVVFPNISSTSFWALEPGHDGLIALARIGRTSSPPLAPKAFPTVSPLDPNGTSLVQNNAFTDGGNVLAFELAPDGTIAYVADQDVDEEFELYAIPAPIFDDGFETGDTTGWSSTNP